MRALSILLATLALISLSACQSNQVDPTSEAVKTQFVAVDNGEFVRNGKPYQFVGFNYWYGPLLGTSDEGKARLRRELDLMQRYGITNLRVLAGGDGGQDDSMVTPALQYEQGKYDQSLLEGLDFLLAEMAKRDMVAVLYLTNNWIWSGGFAQYMEWNGQGKIPNPFLPPHDWDKFQDYTARFHSCQPCMEAFANHVDFIISRTNSVTGVAYVDDPTIMAWQVGNEPRARNAEHEPAFAAWLNRTVDQINQLAPKQLISTGSEGEAGTYGPNPNDPDRYGDVAIWQRLHSNPSIDYLTMHVWPKNWSWYDAENEQASTQLAIDKAKSYMARHLAVAREQQRPIVLSEFGFPRRQEQLNRDADISYRNRFFKSIFDELLATEDCTFAGVNIWGFGGEAKPVSDMKTGKWQPGDDFSGDPPQEPQGLNSVFSSDTSTLELIQQFNQDMQRR
ncbi:endo-1,4-beta-mannosidase [Neiella marina]|uniref:mannan endo-1,4-beta-mannosidase n=1 Tax=Neiella marina TaxID=508461 RepID=A0A8J2U6B9_9GAMM|nr:cellulase family glycosylhydrolase [Neiella marina]GGA81194.1 endo-1,4-beta-mannosidase [Neiella marina]